MSGKGQDQQPGKDRDAKKRPRESTSHGRTEPSSQGAGGDISAALAKQREDYQRISDLQMEQQAAATRQNPYAPLIQENPKEDTTTSTKRGEKSKASGQSHSSQSSKQPGKGTGKRIDVSFLLRTPSPTKDNDRNSPSDEPPKKRPAVAQPSSETTQPGSLSQSAVDPIWTEDAKLEMAAIKWFFKKYVTAESIATKMGRGFSADSVRAQLKLMGPITNPPKPRPYTGEEEETVIEDSRSGLGEVQIAHRLKRTKEDIIDKKIELSREHDLTPRPEFIGKEYDRNLKK